jgi:hypothetical protein
MACHRVTTRGEEQGEKQERTSNGEGEHDPTSNGYPVVDPIVERTSGIGQPHPLRLTLQCFTNLAKKLSP